MDWGIVLGAALAVLVHTLVPNHWLPFVLFGRSREWKLAKTLWVTAIGALCHVCATILLGILIVLLGKGLISDPKLLDTISGSVLVGVGLLYLVLHFLRREHHHTHHLSETLTLLTLYTMMALSPCDDFIVIYLLAASREGTWMLTLVLSLIFIIVTVGGMVLLVWLSSRGVQKLQLHFMDHYEKLIIGIILCLLGAMVFFGH